jgi:murein DD-endopeptidase MepM/ murein hydrolase activator NlpD
MQRFIPCSTGGKHKGTDYAALEELLLPQQRQVLLKNRIHGWKWKLKVKHNGTYSTQYLHMSKILVA